MNSYYTWRIIMQGKYKEMMKSLMKVNRSKFNAIPNLSTQHSTKKVQFSTVKIFLSRNYFKDLLRQILPGVLSYQYPSIRSYHAITSIACTTMCSSKNSIFGKVLVESSCSYQAFKPAQKLFYFNYSFDNFDSYRQVSSTSIELSKQRSCVSLTQVKSYET